MKYLRFLITIVWLCLLPQAIHAQSTEEIISLDTQVTINTNGTIDVEEEIVYDVGTGQKHGIFRKIPVTKTNTEGERFKMTFELKSITDEHGNTHKYKNESTPKYFILKIGDPNKTYTGTKTYRINYQVSGALTYFEDHDELYWNLTGNDWEVPIATSSAKVSLPSSVSSADVQSVCYTGPKGSTLKDCTVVPGESQIALATTTKLESFEGFTAVVSFPKGIVAVLEPKKDNSQLFLTIIFVVLGTLWFVVTPIWVFIKWLKQFIETKKKARIVAAWFDPPKGLHGRKFTPAETGALFDKNVDHRDVTATIIHLAQKGYLKIKVEPKELFGFKTKNISLEKLKDFSKDDTLQKHELHLLEGVFGNKTQPISVTELKSSVRFGKALRTFKKDLSKEFKTKKLFVKDIQKVEQGNIALAMLALFTLNFPLAAVALLLGRKSARRTEKGIEKYSKAASLKNFLRSQEEKLDFQAKNQMFFEKLLPYATAFGVEKQWMEKFKDLKFVPSDWYEGDVDNFGAVYAMTQNLGSSMRSTYSGSSSSSGFSSGFSGGSSGGGGGGGGGGSW